MKYTNGLVLHYYGFLSIVTIITFLVVFLYIKRIDRNFDLVFQSQDCLNSTSFFMRSNFILPIMKIYERKEQCVQLADKYNSNTNLGNEIPC